MDIKKYLIDILQRLSVLETKLESLESHFTNHLHSHKYSKIINTIYFLLVVLMFCFLKWGR